jgi:hypothetical protein
MIKGLDESVWAYTDRNAGEKTKQKKCSTSFRTKNTSFNKNHPDDREPNLDNGLKNIYHDNNNKSLTF